MTFHYEIDGNAEPLSGSVKISGSKNGTLAILPLACLVKKLSLRNVPNTSDVRASIEILKEMGCDVNNQANNVIITNEGLVDIKNLPATLFEKSRGSLFFLGVMCGMYQGSPLYTYGGCGFQERPIDFHLQGLQTLGARIDNDKVVSERLVGSTVDAQHSVGTTINLLYAGVCAQGTTIISNPSRTPEIQNLVDGLNQIGFNVIAQEDRYVIQPSSEVISEECRVTIMPDREEVATFLSAAYITKGTITLEGICQDHIQDLVEFYESLGSVIGIDDTNLRINAENRVNVNGFEIDCKGYPSLGGDYQPLLTLALTQTKGKSIVREWLFPGRIKYIEMLERMGCNIQVAQKILKAGNPHSNLDYYVEIQIPYSPELRAAQVVASNLRAGAVLTLAGLIAQGTTRVYETHHIERGYVNFAQKLSDLGAKVSVRKST